MPNVALFVEDFAHETFLKARVQRLERLTLGLHTCYTNPTRQF
jgi:hypothetical protein